MKVTKELQDLSNAICDFYRVGLDQIRATNRTPDVIVARCAIAFEFHGRGVQYAHIAQWMMKTPKAVEAMCEQYETRAAAAGLPLFPPWSPPAADNDPKPEPDKPVEPAEPAEPVEPSDRSHREILADLVREFGGNVDARNGEVIPPCFGLANTLVAELAEYARRQYAIPITETADFLGVHTAALRVMINQHDKAVEAPPQETAQALPENDQPPQEPGPAPEPPQEPPPKIDSLAAVAELWRARSADIDKPRPLISDFISREILSDLAAHLLHAYSQGTLRVHAPDLNRIVTRLCACLFDALLAELPESKIDTHALAKDRQRSDTGAQS